MHKYSCHIYKWIKKTLAKRKMTKSNGLNKKSLDAYSHLDIESNQNNYESKSIHQI
jgi:hypothetical protein